MAFGEEYEMAGFFDFRPCRRMPDLFQKQRGGHARPGIPVDTQNTAGVFSRQTNRS